MFPGGNVIRVSPTLHAATSTDNDILFQTTEIPNAVADRGGVSKLVSINYSNKQALALNIDLIIMEVKTDWNDGTLGNTLAVSDDAVVSSKVLGIFQWDKAAVTLSSGEINQYAAVDSSTGAADQLPIILKASDGSTSVYFTAIDRDGGDTFTAKDLTFTFGIEYL